MVDGSTFAIVMATFTGPIAAVAMTRWIDYRRDLSQRRMFVFRTLMRTRRMPVSQDHVGALNLVEVEFYRCADVLQIFRELISHYTVNYGDDKSVEQLKAANDKAERIKTRMLSAMAKVLHHSYGEIDLFEGGYVPRGWSDDLEEQRAIRRGVLQILNGLAPLQIAPFVPKNAAGESGTPSAFPPRPA